MKTANIKKFVGLFLAVCLLFGFLPQAAMAEEFGVYVCGVQVTTENANDVLSDGTVSYDSGTNTLTLNGANLSYEGHAINSANDLTIELVGNNTVSIEKNSSQIYASKALTIKGSGSLDVTGKTGTIFAGGLLTIDGATVTSTTLTEWYGGIESNTGIEIKNNANVEVKTDGGLGFQCLNGVGGINPYITISDSRVSLDVGDAWAMGAASDITITNSEIDAKSDGVVIGSDFGDIIISGGTVTAVSNGSESNAIYAADGIVSISNGADITAKTTSESSYPAIYGNDGVTISGSEVTAESAGDCGIFSPETVSITDGSEVTSEGYWQAVRGNNGVTISDSVVNAASSNDVAVYSPSDVTVTDSVVNAEGASGSNGILANGAASVSGSWISTSGDETYDTVNNSVIIKGDSGEVIGNAEVPSDVTLPEGTTLTVPEGATLTVPEGVTLTNNGTIANAGTVLVDGTLAGNEVTGSGAVTHTHSYGTEWKFNAVGHWHECSCGDKQDEAAHIDANGDKVCDVCGYELGSGEPENPVRPVYRDTVTIEVGGEKTESGNKNEENPSTGAQVIYAPILSALTIAAELIAK